MTDLGAHCCDCEWTVTAIDEYRYELNRAMIDHFLETGHAVCRDDLDDRDVADGVDSDP